MIHIDMDQYQSLHEAHTAMKEIIVNWVRLLITTGGSLKLIKCFYHMISFVWIPDVRWKYETNKDNEDLDIAVPITDVYLVCIEHVTVGKSKETLGVHKLPSGGNRGALEAMQDKAQGWLYKEKNGKLQRRSLWFLIDKQLWPKLKYNLCVITSGFIQLGDCLQKQYWQIMIIGEIIRLAPKAI